MGPKLMRPKLVRQKKPTVETKKYECSGDESDDPQPSLLETESKMMTKEGPKPKEGLKQNPTQKGVRTRIGNAGVESNHSSGDEDDDHDSTTSPQPKRAKKPLVKSIEPKPKDKRKETEAPKEKQGTKKKESSNKKGPPKKKQLEEEEEEVEEDIKVPPYLPSLQQRCSLAAFCKLINKRKDFVPQTVWSILEETCFWPLISVFVHEKLGDLQFQRHEIDLEIILRYFRKDEFKFVFGDIEKVIKVEDVSRLFGLNSEGIDDVDMNKQLDVWNRKPSDILDNKKARKNVDRKHIEKTLDDELKKKNKGNPKKVASLILMHLFASFYFAKSTFTISWEAISICEDIGNINQYNWSKLVLDFLKNGLQIYEPMRPKTYNGCVMLIYYWFLENTRVKVMTHGREKRNPTFSRWILKDGIFDISMLKDDPKMIENLIKDGSWEEIMMLSESEEDEDDEDEDEDDIPLTSGDWVPQASQIKKEENSSLTNKMKEIIGEMQSLVNNEKEKEKLIEKVNTLKSANEGLANHVAQLWIELEMSDEKIRTQEKIIDDLNKEVRKHRNHAAALKRKHQREKEENKTSKDEGSKQGPEVGTEEGNKENDNQGEKGGAGDDGEIDLDKVVHGITQQFDGKKSVPEMGSIARGVKSKKREAPQKKKDDTYEYSTPEVAKQEPKKKRKIVKKDDIKWNEVQTDTWTSLQKETADEYRRFLGRCKLEKETFSSMFAKKSIVITRTDIIDLIEEKYIEDTVIKAYSEILRKQVKDSNLHYAALMDIEAAFFAIKHEETKCNGGNSDISIFLIEKLWPIFNKKKVLLPIYHGASKHFSLLVIDNYQRKFIHWNSMQPLEEKDRTISEPNHVRAGYVVKHLRAFIDEVHMSNTYYEQDSQNQDPENFRYKTLGEDKDGNLLTKVVKITKEEKATRKFIIDNDIQRDTYVFEEDYGCPQQNVGSSDCGPYMLHFIEAFMLGSEPTKEGAQGMRKTILEEFLKLRKN